MVGKELFGWFSGCLGGVTGEVRAVSGFTAELVHRLVVPFFRSGQNQT